MKKIITNLALFVLFCFVISGIASCSRTSTANSGVPANNLPAEPPVTNTSPSDTKSSAYPTLLPGVANADMESTDGTVLHVADRKGKVVLLNMWGIWCGPCRAEMPELVALQQTYGDQGFEVIGMNVGDENGKPEDLGNIKTFGEKMKLNYTLVRISSATSNEFYHI